MRVGDGAQPEESSGRTFFARPLRVADEEALIGCQAVFWLKILPGRLHLPGDIGEQRTSKVGHIFAAGQLRVDVNVIDDYVFGVLIALAGNALLEAFGVLRSPPVLEIALRVELTALIVEAIRVSSWPIVPPVLP